VHPKCSTKSPKPQTKASETLEFQWFWTTSRRRGGILPFMADVNVIPYRFSSIRNISGSAIIYYSYAEDENVGIEKEITILRKESVLQVWKTSCSFAKSAQTWNKWRTVFASAVSLMQIALIAWRCTSVPSSKIISSTLGVLFLDAVVCWKRTIVNPFFRTRFLTDGGRRLGKRWLMIRRNSTVPLQTVRLCWSTRKRKLWWKQNVLIVKGCFVHNVKFHGMKDWMQWVRDAECGRERERRCYVGGPCKG